MHPYIVPADMAVSGPSVATAVAWLIGTVVFGVAGAKMHDYNLGPLRLLARVLLYVRAVVFMMSEFREAISWAMTTQWDKCLARARHEQ